MANNLHRAYFGTDSYGRTVHRAIRTDGAIFDRAAATHRHGMTGWKHNSDVVDVTAWGFNVLTEFSEGNMPNWRLPTH